MLIIYSYEEPGDVVLIVAFQDARSSAVPVLEALRELAGLFLRVRAEFDEKGREEGQRPVTNRQIGQLAYQSSDSNPVPGWPNAPFAKVPSDAHMSRVLKDWATVESVTDVKDLVIPSPALAFHIVRGLGGGQRDALLAYELAERARAELGELRGRGNATTEPAVPAKDWTSIAYYRPRGTETEHVTPEFPKVDEILAEWEVGSVVTALAKWREGMARYDAAPLENRAEMRASAEMMCAALAHYLRGSNIFAGSPETEGELPQTIWNVLVASLLGNDQTTWDAEVERHVRLALAATRQANLQPETLGGRGTLAKIFDDRGNQMLMVAALWRLSISGPKSFSLADWFAAAPEERASKSPGRASSHSESQSS
jgi:hypothetical protein